MSSIAVDSINDLPNDPKSRAAQIARIQHYQNNLVENPLVSKKEPEASSAKVTKEISSHSANASSLEGTFAYTPQLIPSEKTQAPQNYPQVERTIASLILDMLPALKGLTAALKLIGVSQEILQTSLGDSWRLYAAASEAYTKAMSDANTQRTQEQNKAAHKMGLFGLIAGIAEFTFGLVQVIGGLAATVGTGGAATPGAALAIAAGIATCIDAAYRIDKSIKILNNPEKLNDAKFMEKDGLMGAMGLNGEAVQYVFQAILILASLGSSALSVGGGKLIETLLTRLGSSRLTQLLSKIADTAFVKGISAFVQGANKVISKIIEFLNKYFFKPFLWVLDKGGDLALVLPKLFLRLLTAAGRYIKILALKISSAFPEASAVFSKILNAIASAVKWVVSSVVSRAESIPPKLIFTLSVLNDLVSLTGILIALGKHQNDPNTSPKDPTALQTILAGFQNGFVGVLTSIAPATMIAHGDKPDELTQSILATALPMVLNSALLASKAGGGMANSSHLVESITRNLNEFQRTIATFGAIATTTSSGQNLSGSMLSEALANIQNQANHDQSAYSASSSMLDSTIASIGNSAGDIQKIIQSISQSMISFVNALNQGIASSSKLLANS
jgi:hypothetical protein